MFSGFHVISRHFRRRGRPCLFVRTKVWVVLYETGKESAKNGGWQIGQGQQEFCGKARNSTVLQACDLSTNLSVGPGHL